MLLTYLDLATSHLTIETVITLRDFADPTTKRASALSAAKWPAMTIADYDDGLMISVPSTSVDMSAVPVDLCAVLAFAQVQNATLIRFDSAGPEVGELQTYDW